MSSQIDNYDLDYVFNLVPKDDLVYNDLFHFIFDEVATNSGAEFPGEIKASKSSTQSETENNPALWNTPEFDLIHIDPHLIPGKSTVVWESMEAGSFSQLDHFLSDTAQQNDHLTSRSSSQTAALSNDESSRRFSTCTSGTDSTTENTNANGPKKRRSSRGRLQITDVEKDEKRKRFLERNRISAQKCRIRKRAKLNQIQERFAYLESEKRLLQSQWVELKKELDGLKKLILKHEQCNHSSLSAWIKNQKMEQAAGSEARGKSDIQSQQTMEELPPQIENTNNCSLQNCLSIDTAFSEVTQPRCSLSSQDSNYVGAQPSTVPGNEKALSSPDDSGVDMRSPTWWQEWLS